MLSGDAPQQSIGRVNALIQQLVKMHACQYHLSGNDNLVLLNLFYELLVPAA
jgi:hypothetical protein